jgi:hypothetical protein
MCCKPQAHHGRDRRMWPTSCVPLLVRRVGLRVVLDLGDAAGVADLAGRPGPRATPAGLDHPVTGKPAGEPRHRRWAGLGWEQAQGWRSRVMMQDQRSHHS